MSEQKLRKELDNLGLNVYAARMNKGWSQEILADKAGVSHVTVFRIESGRRMGIHITSVLQVADALDLSIADLFGERIPITRHFLPRMKRRNRNA